MSRTPLSPSTVHDRADVMRDAHRLDILCRVLAPALEPFAREALARITASTLADEYASEASAALDPMLRDTAALETARQRTHASLSDALHDALPRIDDETVHAHATQLAQLALASWFSTLRHALADTAHVSLIEGLYPDEAARAHLAAVVADDGVHDPAAFFHTVRLALLGSTDVLDVPGDMRLEVVSRGHGSEVHVTVMRTAEAGEPVGSDVAQSGERRRDGAPETNQNKRVK
jgi:hypothetical protein